VAAKAQANQAAVDRFQTDPDCRVIIVSMMAGGLGFTLTAASHMLIVELPWTPKDLDQAEGRSYGRMSDVHGLNAYYVHADGTIDDEMAETIAAKRVISTAIQDGKEVTQTEVLNDMLKRILAR
jgi:SWI/SNF-related matrix-associated actin-dependent regulator 1 of chromatin subfamily A